MKTRVVIQVFYTVFLSFAVSATANAQALRSELFSKQTFGKNDAILVSDEDGNLLYDWRADQAMVPASLVKLLTSWLAIDKWGLEHRFKTEFYRLDDQLWVKGYGDPYLTSEELDLIAQELKSLDLAGLVSLHLDSRYFKNVIVPGRSGVSDPYNAPLSAVAANFNTAMLQRRDGKLVSAEAQTPITATAIKVSSSIKALSANTQQSKPVRVNLRDSATAQRHFAELLLAKTALDVDEIYVDQVLPGQARLIYRHDNSNNLGAVIVSSLLYSNNFIANQVFLKLAEPLLNQSLDFDVALSYVEQAIARDFAWQDANIVEGAGLSRDNRLSAEQIDDVLLNLKTYQHLFKQYDLSSTIGRNAIAYAKTGTLNGVSNYAGYLQLGGTQYRFVFMFNRRVQYGYREQILKELAIDLARLQLQENGI